MRDGGVPRRVFVDFDGVLRREDAPPGRLEADCVARFEAAILACADARVVIASTWRLEFSLPALRGLFSAGFASRIEGATPEVRAAALNKLRRSEVRAYLESVGAPDQPWIAVDDKPSLYGAGAPVLPVDARRGFDDASAAALANWLRL